jgi:hypothetical protein
VSEKVFEAPQITPEEYRKYSGKDVAIYKGKIVADGKTSIEVFKKAKEKFPEAKSEEIEIFYILTSDYYIIV